VRIFKSIIFRWNNKINHGAFQFKFQKVHLAKDGNEIISRLLKENTSFAVSRLGLVEANLVRNHLETKSNPIINSIFGKRSKLDLELMKNAQINAGVFPLDTHYMTEFCKVYYLSIMKIDLFGVWNFIPFERKLIRSRNKYAVLFQASSLDPFRFENPWTNHLEGKTVLVIHPFAKTIEEQYKKRHSMFKNGFTLPEFNLLTLKTFQTNFVEHDDELKNWNNVLEILKHKIDRIEFDIAIIGAGSYGLPLAAYIKDKGKVALHIGSSTQLLFGIKGRRWDENGFKEEFYTEKWVSPSLSDRPDNYQMIENGCYW
jgi:hypothetical protein